MPATFHTSLNQIPQWQENSLRDAVKASQTWLGEEVRPLPKYHSSVANPLANNEDLRRYFDLRQSGIATPRFNAAADLLNSSAESSPENLQPYLSPYLDGYLAEIGNRATQNWIEQIAPHIAGRFIHNGAFGGRHYQATQERMARQLGEHVRSRQNEELHRAYGQAAQMYDHDRRRKQAASEGLSQLGRFEQAANMADMAAAEDAARVRDTYARQQTDLERNEVLFDENRPMDRLMKHASLLHGTPITGQSSYQSRFEPPKPTPGTLSQLGSLAGQLYGASMVQRKRGGPVHAPSPLQSPRRKTPRLGLNSLSQRQPTGMKNPFKSSNFPRGL